jgi:hypothetical protein
MMHCDEVYFGALDLALHGIFLAPMRMTAKNECKSGQNMGLFRKAGCLKRWHKSCVLWSRASFNQFHLTRSI